MTEQVVFKMTILTYKFKAMALGSTMVCPDPHWRGDSGAQVGSILHLKSEEPRAASGIRWWPWQSENPKYWKAKMGLSVTRWLSALVCFPCHFFQRDVKVLINLDESDEQDPRRHSKWTRWLWSTDGPTDGAMDGVFKLVGVFALEYLQLVDLMNLAG